jgi:predicted peroxiredoxin
MGMRLRWTMATYNAKTETVSLSNQAYEKLYLDLVVDTNIILFGYEFAAYAKVKSVRVAKERVYLELTTDGMNIKGGYARKYIKEQFEKMKSGGVKVCVFPHSDNVNVIIPTVFGAIWFDWGEIAIQFLRVELEVEGNNIRMKAKEMGGRVMTYNNVKDTFSSISINRYISMLNSATLVVKTKGGDEMRIGVKALGRLQEEMDVLWSLKVNNKFMSKMTKDIIRKGGNDISCYLGPSLFVEYAQPLVAPNNAP